MNINGRSSVLWKETGQYLPLIGTCPEHLSDEPVSGVDLFAVAMWGIDRQEVEAIQVHTESTPPLNFRELGTRYFDGPDGVRLRAVAAAKGGTFAFACRVRRLSLPSPASQARAIKGGPYKR